MGVYCMETAIAHCSPVSHAGNSQAEGNRMKQRRLQGRVQREKEGSSSFLNDWRCRKSNGGNHETNAFPFLPWTLGTRSRGNRSDRPSWFVADSASLWSDRIRQCLATTCQRQKPRTNWQIQPAVIICLTRSYPMTVSRSKHRPPAPTASPLRPAPPAGLSAASPRPHIPSSWPGW